MLARVFRAMLPLDFDARFPGRGYVYISLLRDAVAEMERRQDNYEAGAPIPGLQKVGVGVIADIIAEFDTHPVQFTDKYKVGASNIVVTGW